MVAFLYLHVRLRMISGFLLLLRKKLPGNVHFPREYVTVQLTCECTGTITTFSFFTVQLKMIQKPLSPVVILPNVRNITYDIQQFIREFFFRLSQQLLNNNDIERRVFNLLYHHSQLARFKQPTAFHFFFL